MTSKRCLLAMVVALNAAALAAQSPAPQTPAKAPAPKLVEDPRFAWQETPDHPRPKIDTPEPQYLYPETPERRKLRIGTAEDPGPDPDPSKHFWRFGKSYHIEKFDRRWEAWDSDPGWVRPVAFANVSREVYQLNDKWLWVWTLDPTDAPPEAPTTQYSDEALTYLREMRSEFTDLTPPASPKTIRFQESSDGLPTSGSWRNSPAVADMNGDGCPDIVAPPERKGQEVPAIFLGDCKGHWKYWTEVRWPHGVDYGSVVAADFNRDGHMDVAFGVHLHGIFVMLGDGKGKFTEVSEGLPRDFATRRIVATDVDHDGYPDIVALSEGPTVARATPNMKGKLRVYYNRKKGTQWEEADIAGDDSKTAGDWLTIANLTGDRHPDVIAATIYQNSNQIVFVTDGSRKWKAFTDPKVVPYLSAYNANAAGKFTSKKVDDAIIGYVRYWPVDLPAEVMPEPPSKTVVGIDRISFAGKQPKRTPVVRWTGLRGITGLAVADFDGDGNDDIIYTRYDPREAVVLLGDGKGGFTRATVSGLKLEPNTNYDIKIADVNGDGRPDVILMYESAASTVLAARDGSIQVFLNRGAAAAPMEATK
jgi:VCBS repeat protein